MNPLNENVAVDLCRCVFVAKISSEAKTLFVAPETSSLVEPLSVAKTLLGADSLLVAETLSVADSLFFGNNVDEISWLERHSSLVIINNPW